MTATLICLAIALHDVDTLRCATGERIRLAGIGAAELNGSRRPGQPFAPGNPLEHRRTLARVMGAEIAQDDGRKGQLWLMAPVRLRCQQTGTTYGRIAAACRLPDGRDLSCAAISANVAKRWASYDRAGRLVRCDR